MKIEQSIRIKWIKLHMHSDPGHCSIYRLFVNLPTEFEVQSLQTPRLNLGEKITKIIVHKEFRAKPAPISIMGRPKIRFIGVFWCI